MKKIGMLTADTVVIEKQTLRDVVFAQLDADWNLRRDILKAPENIDINFRVTFNVVLPIELARELFNEYAEANG